MTHRSRNTLQAAARTIGGPRKNLAALWGGLLVRNVFAVQLAVMLTGIVGYGVSMM